jgi:hypothetical protein
LALGEGAGGDSAGWIADATEGDPEPDAVYPWFDTFDAEAGES